jgi:predicted PurR-regulated permease PerM
MALSSNQSPESNGALPAWMTSYRAMIFWAVLIFLVVWLLVQVKTILLPFVLGLLIAYLCDGLCDRLEKYMSRALAAGLVVVLLIAVLVGAGMALAPLLMQQLTDLLRLLPELIATAKTQFLRYVQSMPVFGEVVPMQEVRAQLGQATGEISHTIKTMVAGLVQSAGALGNALMLLLITPVVAFYCLRDWDKLVATIDRMLPRAHVEVIREQAREIDRTLAGFLRGQLYVCFITAVLYAVGLTLVGLNYGLLIGFASGLLLIVPYAGAALSTAIGIGIALAQFDDLTSVMLVAGVYGLGQVLESNVLTPKLVGDQVNLHPVWLIFGMLAGGVLMGFTGVLIAVPLTAVIGVLIRFAAARYMQSSLYDPAATTRVPLIVGQVQKD